VVTIEARHPDRQLEAQTLALRTGGTEACGDVGLDEIRIVLLEDHAEIWDHTTRRHGLQVGWAQLDLRTGAGNLSHKQPLARAMGKKVQTVFDATGGWGHDAALLSCMGWTVTVVERHPVLAALLNLSLTEAQRHADLLAAIGGRLQVCQGEAAQLLTELPWTPDCVYLDPMFDPRKGSALPRKPAQLLQRIMKPDADATDLFNTARAHCRRVVVKRPDDGEPLGAPPDLTFKGRLVRYDVYLQPIE